MVRSLDLPMPVWIAIGVLVAVQIVVELTALVVLVRTPVERVRWGRKWPWVLIILGVNLIGAVVFLAWGRTAGVAAETAPEEPARQTMAHAADVLYGSSEEAARES